jgi:hypothetical protein
MSFSMEKIESLFPSELSEQRKGRLRDGLKQFLPGDLSQKLYSEFYTQKAYPYFLQGDLIFDLRFPNWDSETREYSKIYSNIALISNTCDIDEANRRSVPKQVMITRLVTVAEFYEELIVNNVKSPETILLSLRNQEYSNLMYFPPIGDTEYIAVFDEMSWITLDELNFLKNDIEQNRIATLDYFGYYLFMFKLSYHFSRLPEETDR